MSGGLHGNMTEEAGLIGKSSEASKGGFKAIKEVEGVLQPPTREKSNFQREDGQPSPDQAKIILENAEIIEMEEGESEPELSEDRFTTYMNYARPGKDKPHQNSFYVKGFMKSGERLDAARRGVKPEEGVLGNLYGTQVCLRTEEVELFSKKIEGTDEKEPVLVSGYIIVEAGGDTGSIEDHIKTLVVGFNEAAARRNLLKDTKAKRHSEYKQALDTGAQALADMLGLEIKDGKFSEVEGAE
jgi:hypothetical protein